MINCKLKIITLLLSCFFALNAQDEYPCGCSDYNSIGNHDMLDIFFPPKLIKDFGYRKARLYYSGSMELNLSQIPEKELNFNSQGHVVRLNWFRNDGQIHYHFDYIRDSLNNLLEHRTYFHLTHSGLDTVLNFENTTYGYDNNGRRILEKNSNSDGKYSADSLSNYVLLEYDDHDRIIKKTSHYYVESDSEPSNKYVNQYEYKEDYSSIEYPKSHSNKWKKETTNNESWLPLQTVFWIIGEDSTYVWEIEKYKYNQSNQITSYSKIALQERISECPEKGSFKEFYLYDNTQLLEEIIHEYDSIKCTIEIRYE